jgi:hypothetical protein
VCEGTAAKSIGFGRAGYVNGPSAALPEVQTHRKYRCSTPFHTCIFSWKSLQILTGKTGFRLEAIDSFNADVPFVFRFRKN